MQILLYKRANQQILNFTVNWNKNKINCNKWYIADHHISCIMININNFDKKDKNITSPINPNLDIIWVGLSKENDLKKI